MRECYLISSHFIIWPLNLVLIMYIMFYQCNFLILFIYLYIGHKAYFFLFLFFKFCNLFHLLIKFIMRFF